MLLSDAMRIPKESRLQAGFTLIEVLVVLIIVALTVSLVSPEFYKISQQIKVSVEEQTVYDVFEQLRVKAFVRQTPYLVYFDGPTMGMAAENFAVSFEFLHFEKNIIQINANGFPDKTLIRYVVNDAEKIFSFSQSSGF